MKLFGQLIRTAVNVVTLPVAVAQDVLTLGGTIVDKKPYTLEHLKKIAEDAQEGK
jgi:hypothetical protein